MDNDCDWMTINQSTSIVVGPGTAVLPYTLSVPVIVFEKVKIPLLEQTYLPIYVRRNGFNWSSAISSLFYCQRNLKTLSMHSIPRMLFLRGIYCPESCFTASTSTQLITSSACCQLVKPSVWRQSVHRTTSPSQHTTFQQTSTLDHVCPIYLAQMPVVAVEVSLE